MKLNHLFFIGVFFVSYLLSGCVGDSANFSGISDSLRAHAIQELRLNLQTQAKWVKVHAAEYLIWLGHPEQVKEIFMEEQRQNGDESPYRIGIWRVLAQTSKTPEEKRMWVDKILKAFQSPDGPDRVHASETLAKLKIPLTIEAQETTQKILKGEKGSLFIYTLWGASISPVDSILIHRRQLLDLLSTSQENEIFRMQAAYVLRHLGGLGAKEWQQLAQIALSESDKSNVRYFLLSAAFMTSPEDSVQSKMYLNVRKKLLRANNSPRKADRMEMLAVLAEKGGVEDLPILFSQFNNEAPISSKSINGSDTNINELENADIRAVAAYAILSIDRKQSTF